MKARLKIVVASAFLGVILWRINAVAQAPDTLSTQANDKGRKASSCLTCHSKEKDFKHLVEEHKRSAHYVIGVDCSDCHGGNPRIETKDAMNPAYGWIGVPKKKDIPQLCASCHGNVQRMLSYGSKLRTDQLLLYRESYHGKALFEKGDTNAAVCTDCHSAHGVLSPRNPLSTVAKKNIPTTCGKCHANKDLMKRYNINSQVVDDYKKGYHAYLVFKEDNSAAPVCHDCHGYHSARPPGVETLEEVCAKCHTATAQFFEQSKHAVVYPKLGIKDCLNCHSPHRLERPTEDYFNPENESACARCHPTGSSQAKIIARINQTIRKVNELQERARTLIVETEKTTHLSMAETRPQLDQITTHLLAARAKQHTLNPQLVEEELKGAQETFDAMAKFAGGLIERAKRVKVIVLVLAILLASYGVYLLIYRKLVLDKIYPWQPYGNDAEHTSHR